ncbi:MAG: penicillin acylase family protein [Myxococcales bacterium]|nr:penicillin acylase family protein [Myxococcales bacterium]
MPRSTAVVRPRAPLAALALALTGALGCASMARSSFPPDHDQIASPTLRGPATVYLDELGVPHVFASDDDDAAFITGYLHARDRRFQTELLRLASQGRLTELLGESLLDVDRRLRLLTYQLDEMVELLPAADRARIDAYAAGINLATETLPRPIEFRLLGYTPEPWTARDTAAVGRFQAWGLSANAEREATFDRALAAAADPARAAWLVRGNPTLGQSIVDPDPMARPKLPPFPIPEPPPMRAAAASPRAAPIARPRDADALRASLADAITHWTEAPWDGSNAFAIAGSRTSDGLPILAGDPHLSLPWPAVFYELHVKTPTVDVSGASFPGMPMIVIGRTPYVAWSLTTSYADVQDLYALSVDPDDATRYLLDDRWVSFTPWPQEFRWGKGDRATTRAEIYRVSHFGPLYNPGREANLAPGRTYALHWLAFTGVSVPMVSSFDTVHRASSPQDVVRGVAMLPTPSQNWTFATADGHIGYVLGGMLPAARASALPLDGTRSASLRAAALPEAERPVVIDPASGVLIPTNQPILQDVGRFNVITSGPHRALRIATALDARPVWDRSSARALQLDTVNLEAARVVPLLLAAVDRGPPPAGRVAEMFNELRAWGYDYETSLRAPLIYESIRGHLHERLLRPHIPDEGARAAFIRDRLSEAVMETALFDPGGAHHWDDPATPGREELRDAILEAAHESERELSGRLGGNMARWTWGRAHTLELRHPFMAKKILRPLFGLGRRPMPGGRHCVYAMGHLGVLGDYKTDDGPALRQVVTPGVEAGFVLPGGNAGQPKHEHAADQFEDWVANRQHAAGGAREQLAATARGVLEFAPTP